jgi:hypothetical protein
MTAELAVIGSVVRVPGSDQLVFALGVVAFLAGAVALAAVLVVRRRRARRGDRRRPVVLAAVAVVALVGAALAVANRPVPFEVPEFPPLPRLLPAEAVFYRPATDLPVAEDSRRWIGALVDADGEPWRLNAGFSGRVVNGVVWGLPFNVVDDLTPRRDVRIVLWTEQSAPGPYPIGASPYIESMPTFGIDNHYLAIDPDRGWAWELLSARRWFGRWYADSGARWRTDSLAYPEGLTIAAGLPLLPGTITYDEVAAGRIGHVILAGSPVVGKGPPVWPARATDGTSENPDAPPMGAWLRLRADADLRGLSPQARVIAAALQEYGTLISDTSGEFALRGTPDRRWDDRQLAELGRFTLADFEVVDASGIRVSPDSMAARPPDRT